MARHGHCRFRPEAASGVLDKSEHGYEGLLHFPQTDNCAPDGVTVQMRFVSSQVAELKLSGQASCQLR